MPTSVRCDRCDKKFRPTVREIPIFHEDVKEEGYYAIPDVAPLRGQMIDCPRCFRGYIRMQDGTWESDRKLVILEE